MSKLLLTASAAFLFVLGVALNFAPAEAVRLSGLEGTSAVPFQLLAGALIGVALMNWFSRSSVFGGVYGRPLGLANVVLFAVGGISLARGAMEIGSPVLWGLTAIYGLFALAFIWVVFIAARFSPPGN
ncbi:hypothetical protein [Brevundimonas sp. A19_0]|uniref:hypothetical protein n=1 Tax=Brevundimonas sp. A19_0 TaxID=2821087 RepID=UPI001ADCD7D9|nr:hypothetical protein [Brevundimonas sp. A19_0]MBO9502793.1 hypothetical protein [Brevundimonas sp. A19_0]